MRAFNFNDRLQKSWTYSHTVSEDSYRNVGRDLSQILPEFMYSYLRFWVLMRLRLMYAQTCSMKLRSGEFAGQ